MPALGQPRGDVGGVSLGSAARLLASKNQQGYLHWATFIGQFSSRNFHCPILIAKLYLIPMSSLTQSNAWKALQAHYAKISPTHMRDLFAQDPKRFEKFSLKFGDI